MNKRKIDDIEPFCLSLDFTKPKAYLTYFYYNPLNMDKIELNDNHIYFKAEISGYTIDCLISCINLILEHKNVLGNCSIFIHVACKGGLLCELNRFFHFKNGVMREIISIIEEECADCGILLAATCRYRIIHKRAICKLSYYRPDSSYWGYFKQCEQDQVNGFKIMLYNYFCNSVESKINSEKLSSYLLRDKGCIWNALKYKKLGLADELI